MDNTNKKMNIAIIGSGISGLSIAYAFSKKNDSNYDITIFESSSKLGGHSYTTDSINFNDVNNNNKSYMLPPVDLGFQVMNRTTYPYLSEMFRELNVETEVCFIIYYISF